MKRREILKFGLAASAAGMAFQGLAFGEAKSAAGVETDGITEDRATRCKGDNEETKRALVHPHGRVGHPHIWEGRGVF